MLPPLSQSEDHTDLARSRRRATWTSLSLSLSLCISLPVTETTTKRRRRGGGKAEASEFVEIGYISSVHGLQGEVRVKSVTAFPELRFGEPGRRWLRTRISGKDDVRAMELTWGRSHSGQKTWILSFNGVDTVEEARQLIGSTILVKEGDRPELEEGEFYTPDLYGMKVILKSSLILYEIFYNILFFNSGDGSEVGTVVNVVNYGSNDLLQVRLNETKGSHDGKGSAGPLVWVPFVEAIVPDVDIDNREIYITPPKGLLELNIRSDTRSKKERRLMGKKEAQQNLSSAKKTLAEIGQEHVLRGFTFGGKDQKRLLGKQIGNINLRLFQHAMGNVSKPFESTIAENGWEISHYSCYSSSDCDENKDLQGLRADGLRLISESKVAIILVPESQKNEKCLPSFSEETTSYVLQLKNALSAYRGFAEANECGSSPPLTILSPARDLKPCQELLLGLDYFGFDKEKVWLLEEEKLPVVNRVQSDQGGHKILLRSPWEIIESPAGPGAIFSPLSSHKIVDNLNAMGVQYVQVCSLSQRCAPGHLLFLGLVNARKVNVGVKIFSDADEDDDIDMIFSMEYLNKVTKQMDELPPFYAVPKQNRHVELVENSWADVEPSEPNSYHLYCPIHDILNSCSMDDVAVLKIVN
ncbi:unnamed protein product [Spirodela intermedia]|uniref:Uncharacterized protein n=1 Tax=Spirodela intermedia TaxID=51605 RepID=A0A7I8JMG7_SPIIN|nr:unnamed protein product [Spirodela intermedia]CAA6671358.1 unnamed protein product [Spirodela intermedia]